MKLPVYLVEHCVALAVFTAGEREKSKEHAKTKRFHDFSTLHRLPGSV
jgi:hypothetical protein